MKNIVYFLIWLITNSIVAQVVITSEDEDNLKSYSSPDFPLSKKLIHTIEAFIKK